MYIIRIFSVFLQIFVMKFIWDEIFRMYYLNAVIFLYTYNHLRKWLIITHDAVWFNSWITTSIILNLNASKQIIYICILYLTFLGDFACDPFRVFLLICMLTL